MIGSGISAEEGGVDSFKDGILTRHIKTVTLAFLSSAVGSSAAFNALLKVQGMVQALTLHICVGAVGPAGTPIKPANYPASPGTWQLTPIVKPPERPRIYLREVFQDPTATDNKDHPLPQDIPFGWSFEPEGAQEAEVSVHVDANAYVGQELDGQLVCDVVAMYTAPWVTPEAFNFAMSRVRIIGDETDIPTIGTSGGG